MIPPSGIHDATCQYVCKIPAVGVDACTAEHSCSVCAMKKRCTFCHAPPDKPCMTVLYEEHVEHGNGKAHEQPHAARMKQ